MKRLRWQILIVVLALVAIAILLASQQTPATVQTFEPEPVSGGIYREALIGSLGRLNPVLDFNNQADRDIDRLLYDSLIRFDDRGLAQAGLAESWGISRDGTIYNFSLRRDARWHDGQPITSADVVFTIELLRSPDLPVPPELRGFWQELEVIALDDYTFQIQLPEPFSPLLDYLAFGLLPEHILGDLSPAGLVDADFNLEPVGSGPYRFDYWLVEQEQIVGVVLAANADYYLGSPFIDQFIFRYFADASAAFAAYQAGEVQGISQVTAEILTAALQEPELNFYTGRLPETSMIFFNLDHPELPFFQDASIRRAFLLGLNRQAMIDRFLNGQATIADGPILPNTWAYFEGIVRLPYDPDQAIEILKQAGYSIPASGGTVRAYEEFELSFTLLHPDDALHTAMAEQIQGSWQAIGVAVRLQALPYDELVSDHLEPRLFHAVLIDLSLMRTPDPDPYPFWHQTQATAGQNYALWNDRQASEYLEQARIIVDPLERTRLYRNFQVRFVNEMPALPLFYPMYTYAVGSEVQGIGFGPLFDPSDRFKDVHQWFLYSEQVVVEIETPVSQP
ncbi:MAG: peptide ABC transporter substrate-binding protein [Anaerolineales bacterium]|nr:peptide ABC transporter substrate-binding protein [Anaerolineales bacterium]